MWTHLWEILGLATLCGLWILFQRWLARVDPDGQTIEERRGGCGSCGKTENGRCGGAVTGARKTNGE